jgi:outer membrane protein assembly factor BamA
MRRRNWMVIPVPVHSPETGWALTLSGIVSTVIAGGPPSSILAVASRSRMHQQSLTLDTALNIGSQWRANGRVAIEDWPTQYFGLDNDTSTDDEEFYDSRNNELRFDLQRELVPGVWVGPQILWRDYDIRDVVSDGLLDAQRPSGFDGGTVSGAGLVATYDTRDDLYTPRSGLYLSGGAVSHGSGLGSNFRFQRHTLDARQFLSVRTNWVLALHQYIESTSGNVPFQELPRLGEAAPPSRLRGYITGRFRDRASVVAQAELRVPLRPRLGAVVFAGVGNVAPRLGAISFSNLKTTGGLGLRYRVLRDQPINLRLDLGLGSDESGVYFGILEAF